MELVLSSQDKDSPLGVKLLAYFTTRLHTLREQNDKSMPDTERALLLARILETKTMIRTFQDEPLPVASSVGYSQHYPLTPLR
jgi:hypothetical protein